MENGTLQEYCNPLQVQLADPWVLLHNGTYFLYGTNEPDPDRGIPVYTSSDLVNWQWRGFALEKSTATWSKARFWGPEVLYLNGLFRMYFNASPGPAPDRPFNMHLCVAESVSPLGPFKELKAPWFRPEGKDDAIDQNVFVDEDGQGFLYWTRVTDGRNEIQVVPLSSDLLSFADVSRLCVRPTEAWESHPWYNHVVNEGAFVFRRDGTYYLTYTGNHFLDTHYAIGYATSTNPLGPWKKATSSPILAATRSIAGPGNGMLVPSPDGSETFIIYHTHQSVREAGRRQVCIDRVTFKSGNPDEIVVTGPTSTPQPLPSGSRWQQWAKDDEFAFHVLDRTQWRVVNEDIDTWHIDNGVLEIVAQDGDMSGDRADFKNLFLQYLPKGNTVITAKLSFEPKASYEQAFLCIWQDHDNFIRFAQTWADGLKLIIGHEQEGIFSDTVIDYCPKSEIFLRIEKVKETYRCLVSADGQTWEQAGLTIEQFLNLPQAGLGVVTRGKGRPLKARFLSISFS